MKENLFASGHSVVGSRTQRRLSRWMPKAVQRSGLNNSNSKCKSNSRNNYNNSKGSSDSNSNNSNSSSSSSSSSLSRPVHGLAPRAPREAPGGAPREQVVLVYTCVCIYIYIYIYMIKVTWASLVSSHPSKLIMFIWSPCGRRRWCRPSPPNMTWCNMIWCDII